jgi:hypothetical protein
MKIYQEIASLAGAYHRCIKSNNEYSQKHKWELERIEKDWLPRGFGIDSGTKIDLDNTNDDKITLICDFHHMDNNGYYCGWRQYKIKIKPSFQGFDINITGRDPHFIKDYLFDVYNNDLNKEYVREQIPA